jgi:SAM-dependent methyltransferase
MAGFYDRHILPHLIQCACGAPTLTLKRADLIPRARGAVIEIGCGGGLNFGLYDPARVTRVVGLDPSAELLEMARPAAAAARVAVELTEGVAEALPFPDASFDTAVLTFTLCSVGDPMAALREVRRVLRPGGELLFCEHGLAPDANVRRWQGRIEPVWKRIAGGCHLTRPVGGSLRQAGFTTSGGGQGYLMAPRFAGWIEWGRARPGG